MELDIDLIHNGRKPDKCIICDSDRPGLLLIKSPHFDSLDNLAKYILQRVDIGDAKCTEIQDRIGSCTAEHLTNLDSSILLSRYHRSCYQEITNKTNFERLRVRTVNKFKTVNLQPNTEEEENPSTTRKTRSSTEPLKKRQCFFCQQVKNEPLHEMCTSNADQKLRDAIARHPNDALKIRLSTVEVDARAADLKYHRWCWVRNVVRLGGSAQEAKARTREEVIKSLVKFELIQIVDVQSRRGTIITTNDLLAIYTSLLAGLGCQDERDVRVKKKQLRQLVIEEIPDVEFSQALRRNEPDRLIRHHQYLEVVRSAVEMAIYEEGEEEEKGEEEEEEIADDVEVEALWSAASILRKEALGFISEQARNFDGSASIDESGVPPKLLMFLRWFLAGKGNLHGKRNDIVDRSSITIGNQMLYSAKTARQIAYTPVNAEKTYFKNTPANKQATILGLAVRQHGRQKAVVDMLHGLDMTIFFFLFFFIFFFKSHGT